MLPELQVLRSKVAAHIGMLIATQEFMASLLKTLQEQAREIDELLTVVNERT